MNEKTEIRYMLQGWALNKRKYLAHGRSKANCEIIMLSTNGSNVIDDQILPLIGNYVKDEGFARKMQLKIIILWELSKQYISSFSGVNFDTPHPQQLKFIYDVNL